jgi:conjugal transfer/type IV secretion protein DotA/TraY
MSAIRTAALTAKVVAVNKIMADVETWVAEWPTTANEPGWDNVQSNRFNQIVNEAQSAMMTSLTAQIAADSTLKTIMQQYVNDITADGWALAGGFYQRLSGMRQEVAQIYGENVAQATAPNLNSLPNGPHATACANQLHHCLQSLIGKSLSGASYTRRRIHVGRHLSALGQVVWTICLSTHSAAGETA